jgi:hypothetical protein|tara:strand:- start:2 stop:529 length:528 start_codon:yes stop_codon:yes gene_type:complete
MQINLLKLPNEIINEVEEWKLTCDKIKNSPLKHLKEHDNIGTKTNHYQTSVPVHLIESSYWLPFTLRSCAKLFGGNHRNYFIKKWDGHFDGYDVWINYSCKGNYNPPHAHSGAISGIIYLQNNKDETIFINNNYKHNGNKGDMLLFPSNTLHKVDIQKKDYERITFAFNINYREF